MDEDKLKRFAVFAHSPQYEVGDCFSGGINDIAATFDDQADAIAYAQTLNNSIVHVFDFDTRKIVWDRSWPNSFN